MQFSLDQEWVFWWITSIIYSVPYQVMKNVKAENGDMNENLVWMLEKSCLLFGMC